jgi:hypothetical protein
LTGGKGLGLGPKIVLIVTSIVTLVGCLIAAIVHPGTEEWIEWAIAFLLYAVFPFRITVGVGRRGGYTTTWFWCALFFSVLTFLYYYLYWQKLHPIDDFKAEPEPESQETDHS